MIFAFRRRPATIRQAVSTHVSARASTRRSAHYSRAPWGILTAPVRHLALLRERRAVRVLVDLEPRNADEAQEKLLYLVALLGANAAPLAYAELRKAIVTLQPFKPCLAEAMSRGERTSLCSTPRENIVSPGMRIE